MRASIRVPNLQRPAASTQPPAPSAQQSTSSSRHSDRLVAGCMTGTSLDALDAVVARIHGRGLRMRAELVAHSTLPLGDLGLGLRRLAEQQALNAGEISMLMRDFALLHLEALKPLHQKHRLDLICVHGQTVFHAPPLSWQLFQPAPLAHALGVPVVCDLRAADLACGGQGAPITPIADHVLFRHGREARAIVNLGGFCNLTRLPGGADPGPIQGRDVCACNQVLDAVAREVLDRAYDENGEAALAGTPDERAVDDLARRLGMQSKGGRSLGTGDECAAWIARHRARTPPADLAASACAAVATTIAKACLDVERVIVAGGGVRNRALFNELKARCAAPVEDSDKYGVPAGYREALGFAVLGALCQDRIPITIPAVTGVGKAPISGLWCMP